VNPIATLAAAREKPSRPCAICILPEVDDINRAYLAPYGKGHVSAGKLAEVLVEDLKHEHVTFPMVTNHFQRRHHVARRAR
jgi:hypothetical protein